LPNPPTTTVQRTTSESRFRTASPSPATEDTIDSKPIDILLNELSVVLARWNLYLKFLAVKCQYDLPTLVIPTFLSTSLLADKFSRVRVAFEALETFFFRRSVEKAFQLDEPSTGAGPPTTSVVDDVLFVLKKVIDRALGTGDIDLLRTMCANIRRILELDFAGVVSRRIILDSQRSLSSGDRIRTFIAGVNNLDGAGESVIELCGGYVSRGLEGVFPFGTDVEFAKTALGSVENLKGRFDGYLHVRSQGEAG
jgi:conserved oligomeric Golgi complex subunit 4